MQERHRCLFEMTLVLGLMLCVKALADAFGLLGAGSLAMWCGIGFATVLMRKRGGSWVALGVGAPHGGKEWLRTIGLATLAVVAVFLILGLVVAPICERFGLEAPPEAGDRFQFFLGRPGMFFAYLFGINWLGAALGEELLMRGFLMNRLADLFGRSRRGWILAALAQASIFGSLHVYQGLRGILSTAIIGLIFAAIYHLAGRRLLPLVLGHGLINTITLSAFYLSDGVVQ